MTIKQLVDEAYNLAKEKGWYETKRSIPELLCLMHSEVSEALEDFRKGYKVEDVYYEGEKPCGIGIELADTIIRIADMAGAYGLPLDELIAEKLEYNRTRSYRHGNKVV